MGFVISVPGFSHDSHIDARLHRLNAIAKDVLHGGVLVCISLNKVATCCGEDKYLYSNSIYSPWG